LGLPDAGAARRRAATNKIGGVKSAVAAGIDGDDNRIGRLGFGSHDQQPSGGLHDGDAEDEARHRCQANERQRCEGPFPTRRGAHQRLITMRPGRCQISGFVFLSAEKTFNSDITYLFS
jgi:hypothetical protein